MKSNVPDIPAQPEHTAEVGERVARLEASMSTVTEDVSKLRDRSHSLANEMQKLIGTVNTLNGSVDRLANSVDAQNAKYIEVNSALSNHVTACREDNQQARDDRLAFRREMRRHMVTILTTIIVYAIGTIVAGNVHISIAGPG